MSADDRVRWATALEVERRTRTALDGPVPPTADLVRAWWAAIADLLNEDARQSASGAAPEPRPVEFQRVLADLCGYLAVGSIPAPIADVVTKGRVGPGPSEMKDIRLAVAYRQACRVEGLRHGEGALHIQDAAPVKTLAAWYGVNSRTMSGWLARYSPADLPPTPLSTKRLIRLTQSAGERYRSAGRAASSVAARGKR